MCGKREDPGACPFTNPATIGLQRASKDLPRTKEAYPHAGKDHARWTILREVYALPRGRSIDRPTLRSFA